MSTTPTPPPGCPAHGSSPGGLRRLYGLEAEADPMGLYEKLRAEHGPVAPVLVHGDLPAWLVLGHAENLHVAHNPSLFSRDSRLWGDMKEGNVPPDHPLTPVAAWQPVCNFVDGGDHKRLRGAVTTATGRFDRRGIRHHVSRQAHALIDRFEGVGQADLVSDFATYLPMLVMTRLVGMPESYGPKLVEAARDMLQGTDTAVASNSYITVALEQLVERKRTTPGHDLATFLIEDPARLTDAEIIEHLRLVLIGAFEKTANLIANTLRLVLTDNRFRNSLSGGHMTLPDALDQILWDEPPLTTILGRWATSDTDLAGYRIKAGDMLLLGLAAGNVDPAIRPDLAIPLHGNRSHLAFGGGPHDCPGQDIGRAIADTGIEILLARLPDLTLSCSEGDLRWTSSLMSRHLTALPVEFTARSTAKSSPRKGASLPPQRRAEPDSEAVPTGVEGAREGKPTSFFSRLLRG
ncbi:cytochrome P450 [Streptomyces sp. NPDC048248]|uniref:cytochrome P450 n=1 Tax=Streptomyces sp. NPDC048248 TaxID=3365523 RepID=UPI0037239AD1